MGSFEKNGLSSRIYSELGGDSLPCLGRVGGFAYSLSCTMFLIFEESAPIGETLQPSPIDGGTFLKNLLLCNENI